MAAGGKSPKEPKDSKDPTDLKDFKDWALHENVAITSPLEQFRDKRVGIDAGDYLHSLLTKHRREHLVPALAGRPFGLYSGVDEYIEGFKAANIEPIFIFDGLDLACRDRTAVLNEGRLASNILNEAWTIYDEGKGAEAVDQFGKALTYRTYHIARGLQMYLHSKGARVLRAPYSAAAQLAAMERDGLIDAVHGSASCMLFGADRVILNIDWTKDSVVWLSESKCLSKLELNKDQFISACLIAGYGILPTFSDLEGEISEFRMVVARNLLRGVNFDVDGLLRAKEERYHNLFHLARFALKFAPVLKESGEVEFPDLQKCPGDAHAWIGQRLPDELYFYLSCGVIGPRILNWRTRGEILETPPLDGGHSQAYRDLVRQKLKPLRAQAVALVTQSLHRYYQKKEIQLWCWWHEVEGEALGTAEVTDPSKGADKWLVQGSSLSQLRVSGSEAGPLMAALDMLADNAKARSTVSSQSPGTAQIREVEEIRANIVWRFLQARGYLNSDHTLSALGKALRVAIKHGLEDSEDTSHPRAMELEETVLMAFELIRLEMLNKQIMFQAPPYSGGATRGLDTDKANVSLISRVACLGYLQHGSIGYHGPLSRNLLAYQQCTAAVRGALRDLLEMHACHMLLSGAVDRTIPNRAYTDIAASLPLLAEPDIGLALNVKCYLDELSQQHAKRQDVDSWFVHAEDTKGDREKAWKLWGAVNAGVQAAEGNTISSDTKKMFQNADDWLKEKLEQAKAPNGIA